MKEEFGEYVELSRGAVMLEVTDAAGTVLSRPSRPGWAALADEASLAAIPSAAPVNRVESGEPFRVARATFHAGAAEYRAVVATSTRASHDALRRFAWLLGGLAPAVLLIAGLGGYWIAGRALAPVDRMTRTVQETTLRSLDRRLEVPAADDELRRLAVTFNEMLARMQVGVADLTRLTAEASHELRTPVSLVRTTAEIALSRPRPADEYRQALKDVLAHAEHMSALVGDLLLLARADAGVEAGESSPSICPRSPATSARSFSWPPPAARWGSSCRPRPRSTCGATPDRSGGCSSFCSRTPSRTRHRAATSTCACRDRTPTGRGPRSSR